MALQERDLFNWLLTDWSLFDFDFEIGQVAFDLLRLFKLSRSWRRRLISPRPVALLHPRVGPPPRLEPSLELTHYETIRAAQRVGPNIGHIRIVRFRAEPVTTEAINAKVTRAKLDMAAQPYPRMKKVEQQTSCVTAMPKCPTQLSGLVPVVGHAVNDATGEKLPGGAIAVFNTIYGKFDNEDKPYWWNDTAPWPGRPLKKWVTPQLLLRNTHQQLYHYLRLEALYQRRDNMLRNTLKQKAMRYIYSYDIRFKTQEELVNLISTVVTQVMLGHPVDEMYDKLLVDQGLIAPETSQNFPGRGQFFNNRRCVFMRLIMWISKFLV